MREELLPSNLEDFIERFGTFHDAVIHDVKLNLFGKIKPYTIVVTIGTQDLNSDLDNNWINIIFEIEDVSKFTLKKGRRYDFSIIFELNIAFYDNEVFFDFFPFTSKPTGPEDFEDIPDVHDPRFAVAGKKCFWEITPYIERIGPQ